LASLPVLLATIFGHSSDLILGQVMLDQDSDPVIPPHPGGRGGSKDGEAPWGPICRNTEL
jgi:hypothetical protein